MTFIRRDNENEWQKEAPATISYAWALSRKGSLKAELFLMMTLFH